ncbi:uncharacterized protein CELE_T25D10.4 [Caenorhabditis elegans]|uniref:Uncharacterized protein T25D10.4 n=1 Tax=Caenorhabditis elegans TaxID=6239 RepID=YSW4_CAEEL|nr:Uncharacterized protein CELE_T25D10.4 [Caenorhabditis elegans]Q10019.1 RecName: Full=Uncharacterized protein T25D10.4 [Caenorhabditis elegans]CCD72076.1 Uncharacterized protein CELE_T25D10.4 [Caenorhabditis elegans]|eukprot:NP_495292.1 Uncharacterized protein CELE_T25D10.4 [Caenorhabditis elegans]
MEDLDAYRAACANRIRRLERYKKARSFCSLETDEPTSSSPSLSSNSDVSQENGSSTFDMIREKMFSLMENDMTLLKQLLQLGDQISEIKKERLRRTMSQNSLEYDEEDEKEDKFDSGFSASMSAVTNLYVDDERPQFFSRQNSVLRIPIPPRSSNRFGPRRVIRRPSDILPRQQTNNIRTLHVNSDDSDSSSSGSKTHSPSSSVYNASTLILPSKTTKNRSSNSSIDSGIRDEQLTPSPTFESVVI